MSVPADWRAWALGLIGSLLAALVAVVITEVIGTMRELQRTDAALTSQVDSLERRVEAMENRVIRYPR